MQRKTVTVLFCDVTGSTALGESVDPEALRGLLARYFERMKAIVESHGGTVEKFVGDAVMAVFGVPVLHEDDALRAVRAAAEMRDALPDLGVQARIGVNTGEVVTGTEERLATGDAVNVAARLEQAAQPGEILLGLETLHLVRDAADVEPVEPLTLKGKAEPVLAYRLLAVHEALGRRVDGAFVGRGRELGLLRDGFARAVSDRSCHLFTLLGTAGVGKSRLVDEFLASLDDIRVVRGRCLSYGEGIAYYPVVEVVLQLRDSFDDLDAVARRALEGLLGEGPASPAEETAWAVRKLLEAAATPEALVVVLDDIHWGEPTFFDLVEHVADLSRDAPILLLCVARPELLDVRAGWSGGKLNATTTLLEPLSADETDSLLDALGGVEAALRERIRTAADGNPLFVEEMVAMVRESDNGDVAVPPTIQALLAARLDQLPRDERGVLECGAVEGKEFHRGAVAALAPGEPPDAPLTTLVRKDLIRPDRATLPGEDAYRFRHLLIRDAAYESLPKATRAELHERFAEWLDERGSDLVERDEIVGYHLEQAYRYRAELGEARPALGERAAERLGNAGRRAAGRQDAVSARALLARAASLLPTDGLRRIELSVALGVALVDTAEFLEAERVLEEALRSATAVGDERLRLRAELELLSARAYRESDMRHRIALAETAQRAIPVFEVAGDDLALARAWNLFSDLDWAACRWTARAEALERALVHARRAGDHNTEVMIAHHLAVAYGQGPATVDELEARAVDWERESARNPGLAWAARRLRTHCHRMRGEFEEARRLWEQNYAEICELGQTFKTFGALHTRGMIEYNAGDLELCADYQQQSSEGLKAVGETNVLSTFSGDYAITLAELGRLEQAEAYAVQSRDLAGADDVASQIWWRTAMGLVEAERGNIAEAESLLREAVELLTGEQPEVEARTMLALARVLERTGRMGEAAAAVEEAAACYDRKGHLAGARLARARLAELTV